MINLIGKKKNQSSSSQICIFSFLFSNLCCCFFVDTSLLKGHKLNG